MQTSSNQLARDSEAGFEKTKPKEEKIDLPYEAYFRILILDGNEVMDSGKIGIRARLLDMSRFGCRIACKEPLDLTEGIDSLLEGCIESPRFQFDRRMHGFIVRQDEAEAGFEYAIQFNHSLNVDFVHSFLYAAHVVKDDVRHYIQQEVPDHEAMALRYRIRHTVSKLMPHLQELDHSLSIYNYELKNEHREAIPSILYKELKPVFDDIRDVTNVLYEKLEDEPEKLNFNFEYLRSECRDLLFSDPFIKRATEKPLGYAGDFEMMESLYRNENEGFNLFGQALHRWVMEMNSARAVKGRQEYFYKIIQNRLERLDEYGRDKLVVLSLACGPAQEIVSLVKNTPQELLDRVEIYLLDQDPRAVVQARHGIRVAMMESLRDVECTTINKELSRFLKVAPGYMGRPIDLIYSAGLFDYIKLGMAQKICSRLYNLLSMNGEIYLGNFTDENNEKGMMEMMDWRLIYRSDQELLDFGAQVSGKYDAEVVEDISPQRYIHLTRKEAPAPPPAPTASDKKQQKPNWFIKVANRLMEKLTP